MLSLTCWASCSIEENKVIIIWFEIRRLPEIGELLYSWKKGEYIKKDREKIYVAKGKRRLTTKKGGIFKSICIQRFIRVTSYFAANKVDISTIIMVTIYQQIKLKTEKSAILLGSSTNCLKG